VEALVTDALATTAQPLQGRDGGPATSSDPFPKDIRANGHPLSVEEHYRIARMPIGGVRQRYVIKDAEEFVTRVKAAIRFWDGVDV